MADLFVIKFKWSESHLVFPRIIAGILVLLAIVLVIQRATRCKREGTPFVSFKGYRFFAKDYDKVKFWGFLVLMPCYIFALETIGFLKAGLVFIFLLNVLFAESVDFRAIASGKLSAAVNVRSLLNSACITVVATVGIWYLFGVVFNITLP